MTFVCLWIPSWSTGAASTAEATPPARVLPPPDLLIEALLEVAPRVAIAERGLLWADARGLCVRSLAESLCEIVRSRWEEMGDGMRAGAARTAIAAEVAATATVESGGDSEMQTLVIVPPGRDRFFLAPYPLRVLRAIADPDPLLLSLFAGVGIETCGDLAALEQEEVEVRCGVEGVRLWRLSRAEDRRRPFGALPRELPRASCAWTDYALRDAERLLFVINRLVGHVCDALQARGEGARELLLRFALADRSVFDHPLRAAHATSDRSVWLRLARTALEYVRLRDAVTGIIVGVGAAAPLIDQQGDVFDRGFATARATEQAVAQLLDSCGADAVALAVTDHPLLERRVQWRVREQVTLDSTYAASPAPSVNRPSLTLQLLPEPRPVRVVTESRRDHAVPVRYHERPLGAKKTRGEPHGGTAVEVVTAVGPDRIDGGLWEAAPYAREYFQCVTRDGRLVLLFQAADGWYLHGWWD
jgi:protein ImuB